MNKHENSILTKIWDCIKKQAQHIEKINEELGDVRENMVGVRTDVSWLKKLVFLVLPILAGMVVTLIYFALKLR